MLEIIRFDERASAWLNDDVINKAFLRVQANYIKDLYSFRGYVYLNQIYETLGIEWEPERYENVCYCGKPHTLHIDIVPSSQRNIYLFKIYQN